MQFFADAGFPCRTRTNPTDHFLRCVNSDFDNINIPTSFFRSRSSTYTQQSAVICTLLLSFLI